MGLHGCVWRDTGEGLQVDVGVPRGTLDEGVGGIRELGSSCLNRAKLGRECCRCVLDLGRDGVCLHDVLEFQERLPCSTVTTLPVFLTDFKIASRSRGRIDKRLITST